MAKASTRDKETRFAPEVMRKIIWGVYRKFRTRYSDEQRSTYYVKAKLNLLIMADIFLYLHENYSSSKDRNKHVNEKIIAEISKNLRSVYKEFSESKIEHKIIVSVKKILSEYERKIKKKEDNSNPTRWFKVVDKRRFEDFLSTSNLLLIYQGVESIIPCDIPEIQLEALCLYGWDATYEHVCKSNDFYKDNGKIRFMPTDLSEVFEPTLISVLNSFEKADEQGTSPRVKKRVSEVFMKETERLFEDLSSGRIPTRDYLKELKDSMEQCDRGFGVSIPKFNAYWEKEGADHILALNLMQAQGFPDVKRVPTKALAPWTRIFFVEGVSGTTQLLEEEKVRLREQLLNGVTVFVVFHDAWKHLKDEELKKCDFAVFRTEDHPTLMVTKFSEDDADGVFYYDESVPEIYYKKHMENILHEKNAEQIFKPELNNDRTAVLLDKPIGAYWLGKLADDLWKIYKKS